jgi:osmotically-inducible protein OsmY
VLVTGTSRDVAPFTSREGNARSKNHWPGNARPASNDEAAYREEDIMRYWMTGLAVAALVVTAPALTLAQSSTTDKTEKAADKAESKTDKAMNKAEGQVEKAKTGTKDSWITAKTKIALYGDDRVSGSSVNVDTKKGVVTLRGKVASDDEKKAAEEDAKGIEGVTSVKNELKVVAPAERKAVDAKDEDLTKSVKSRMKNDARLKSVDVRTDKGTVTLTGEVQDVSASARASEIARGVPGVRSVKNELKEKQG